MSRFYCRQLIRLETSRFPENSARLLMACNNRTLSVLSVCLYALHACICVL